MHWIDDIRSDIAALRSDRETLRKFGLTVGTVFLLIGAAGYWFEWQHQWIVAAAAGTGTVLLTAGTAFPDRLSSIYRYWMILAIVIGSLVARIILFFLFYFIVTTISVIARLAGKRFSQQYKGGQESYWIQREKNSTIDYQRMS